MHKAWKWVGLGLAVFFVGGQLVRPERTNLVADPSHEFTNAMAVPPATAELIYQACGDCHSNRTVWPWYSGVAPISWWVAGHVNEGRRKLNFSNWAYPDDRTRRKLDGIVEEVKSGDMPPAYYTPMHPPSRLTDAQRASIVEWAQAELARRGGPLPRESHGH